MHSVGTSALSPGLLSDVRTTPPAISVALCNYNHAKYLEQCLAGILRQTFRNFEVILTDDGSTDGSQEIIRRHSATDDRIRPIFIAKNGGLMAAAAKTMAVAKGALIYGEASDDFLVDNTFFERAIKALRAHPTAAGFYAVTGILSAETNQISGMMGSGPHEGFISPEEFYRTFVRRQLFVPGSSSIWRRDLMDTLGGYDLTLGPQADYFVNHALPSQHGVIFASAPVKIMRTFAKPTSYSSNNTIAEKVARFARVEERLRELIAPYPGVEHDWESWRLGMMADFMKQNQS